MDTSIKNSSSGVGGGAGGNGVDWEEKINLSQSTVQTLYKPYESNNNTAIEQQNNASSAVSTELLTYYQLLKSFYDANLPINPDAIMNQQEGIKSFHISNLLQQNDVVDLTKVSSNSNVSANNNININIDGDNKNVPSANLMSVDVSINVSKNTSDDTINELKISCKTTPPKKRYSGASFEAEVKTEEGNGMRIDCNEQQKQKENERLRSELGSTYLQMTRSMGLADDDALNLVSFYCCKINLLPLKGVNIERNREVDRIQ